MDGRGLFLHVRYLVWLGHKAPLLVGILDDGPGNLLSLPFTHFTTPAYLLRICFQTCRIGNDCSAAVASLYEACLEDDPKLRPTAPDIVHILETDWLGLNSQASICEPFVGKAARPRCKLWQDRHNP
jgi:hypothetical protein